MNRPYLQKRFRELEALFRTQACDPNVLRALLAELDHRRTPKARGLRERVEAALRDVSKDFELVSPTAQDFESRQDTRPEPSRKATAPAVPDPSEVLPNEFRRVAARGCTGRPAKYVPKLKTDLKLAEAEASRAARYVDGLELLVEEIRRKGYGELRIELENGLRKPLDGSKCGYLFDFSEEANLFEGAEVQVVVGGRMAPGQVVSLLPNKLLLALDEDFGEHLNHCLLKTDSAALLVSLKDRLSQAEKRELTGFNTSLAENVLEGAPRILERVPLPRVADNYGLNTKQVQGVERGLGSEALYLWGPPGTGKTQTLAALVHSLYAQGKRVLVCSNTNQAVDQLLLKLARVLQAHDPQVLDTGHVVRVGRISHNELQGEFSAYVGLEGIVERKSESLRERKAEVERQLACLAQTVEGAQGLLEVFKRLDQYQRSLEKIRQSEAEARKRETDSLDAIERKEATLTQLRQELDARAAAGMLRRMLMRSEQNVREDIQRNERALRVAQDEAATAKADCERLARKFSDAQGAIARMQEHLRGQDRTALARQVEEYEKQRQPFSEELADLNRQIDDVQRTALEQARVIGATVTKSYLSPSLFSGFDAVVIDEASMILPPAVFYASGLAKEKVVVAGDFAQLPPIVQTEQQALADLFATTVFATAGIEKQCADGALDERVVMLDEQYRMDPAICGLISGLFYRGQLRTGDREKKEKAPPDPFAGPLTVIDTSRIWPFAARDRVKSRFNMMHALAARNLCRYLKREGFIEGTTDLGICTPYAAQAKLFRKILSGEGLGDSIAAGTVHRYQGDEKNMMLLDLVDSVGDPNAGIFLQATAMADAGAKLFNVAVSRAENHLVVLANLTYLDEKLPCDAYLREILYEMQRKGRVIDVQEVLDLYPIEEDLPSRTHMSADLNFRHGAVSQREFEALAQEDMTEAKQSITIFSGFITPRRVASYGDLFRRKLAEGLKIRCVTRPPRDNGSIPEEQGREALRALEGIGVTIDLRRYIHQKLVLIDDQIAWIGSLNPLSHTARTEEIMMRMDNREAVQQIIELVTVTRAKEVEVHQKENPACGSCGGWTIYAMGRYGPYFACESECGWTQSFDRSSRAPKKVSGGKGGEPKPAVNGPACPKCGKTTRLREGRYGHFYGCVKYPECNGTAQVKGKKTTGRVKAKKSSERGRKVKRRVV
ncbi:MULTISPECIES: AAA domain-containing protein [unclassified Thioalkalivibrio]|uniref:AAA domain-containing protein n=1 Tax=unclassified Thioalkalivibrio TaxID=2621013 RepID=UPI00037542AB|nr:MULTISPECIES: AAA domain-containing protein [unclassified Thioalkalivibrio]